MIDDTADPAAAVNGLPPDDFVPPVGTQNLLDAQLGEALKIMRDFTRWIQTPAAGVVQCIHVSNAVGSLMNSSAAVATVSARLQEASNAPDDGRRAKSKTNKP